jgi:hydrogenase maturation protein HypF
LDRVNGWGFDLLSEDDMTSSKSIADRHHPKVQRRACWVQGIVQGVGFRPFVHRAAVKLGLAGFVRNQSGLVYLEAEGATATLDELARIIQNDPPRLSRVESVQWLSLTPRGSTGFCIEDSVANDSPLVFVSPDVATCDDCLRELFDPADRRFLYPFINCMNCGPRLTIIRAAPYDRLRTTMCDFEMCGACRSEYSDPSDRRFHAQPIACRACGPQLSLRMKSGQLLDSANPLQEFAAALVAGNIGALKGLGGYHLACDATDESVVATLRQRKHRDEKPFAIMVGSLEQARQICEIDESEAALLSSLRRPIVLLRRGQQTEAGKIANGVAPGNPYLGVMLPYTPLHHLLLRAMNDRPVIMTSGNRSDEPMAHLDQNAFERLADIVDLFLTHNREIHVRCDDSVTRFVSGQELPIRRARGYAPEPVTLPTALRRPTLAVGGQLKATFALGRDRLAFLSHHLGDLDHFPAWQAFEHDLTLYEKLFSVRPELIVHDLHPDYASTGYATTRARADGIPTLAVQHHHAHLASGMAEHGLTGSVIGVAFDGTGFGTDGAIWGGEFLVGSYNGFHRAAQLRYVGLPGGDAAVRAPWRSAVSQLSDAGCDIGEFVGSVSSSELRTVGQMLERKINCPLTSSMGRLFDAVAAIAGIRTAVTYEGQAAVELEAAATELDDKSPPSYPFEIVLKSGNGHTSQYEIDTRPLIRAVAADVLARCAVSVIAGRFQSTVVRIVCDVCQRLRSVWGLERVVLSGGVFMNAKLVAQSSQELASLGFDVYRQTLVPCNDGGISLGQLAIAAASDQLSESRRTR